MAVRAPPRRAVGDQAILRTPKEAKAFVFSKDYDLLVTGGRHWAVPALPGRGCGVQHRAGGRAVVSWLPVQGGSHCCLC